MTPTAPGPDYGFWLNLAVLVISGLLTVLMGIMLRQVYGIAADVKELRATSSDHEARLAEGDEKFRGFEKWKDDAERRIRELERGTPARAIGQ